MLDYDELVDSSFRACHGNTGNAVIGHAMEKLIQKAGFTVIDNFASMQSADVQQLADRVVPLLRRADCVFLCLQDILRIDALDIWPECFFDMCDIIAEEAFGKLCVVSLGANSFDDLSIDVDTLFNSIPGRVTSSVMNLLASSVAFQARSHDLSAHLHVKFPNARLMQSGCPSIFMQQIKEDLLLGNARRLAKGFREERRISVGGLFGTQRPEIATRIFVVAQEYREIKLKSYLYEAASAQPYPNYWLSVASAVARKDIYTFFNPADWLNLIERKDPALYVGTRLHGGIINLLCGVPCVFTGGDARTSKFCDLFGLPHQTQIFIEEGFDCIAKWNVSDSLAEIKKAADSFCSSLAEVGQECASRK